MTGALFVDGLIEKIVGEDGAVAIDGDRIGEGEGDGFVFELGHDGGEEVFIG